jgi:hypothetical protein
MEDNSGKRGIREPTPVFGLLVVPLSLVYFVVLGVKTVFR